MTSYFKDFLKVLAALVILYALFFLTGCANLESMGIQMNDEEAKACKEQGCSVWTPTELDTAARGTFFKGIEEGIRLERQRTGRGWKDGA